MPKNWSLLKISGYTRFMIVFFSSTFFKFPFSRIIPALMFNSYESTAVIHSLNYWGLAEIKCDSNWFCCVFKCRWLSSVKNQNVCDKHTLFPPGIYVSRFIFLSAQMCESNFPCIRGISLRVEATEVLSQWSFISFFIRKVSVYMHLH